MKAYAYGIIHADGNIYTARSSSGFTSNNYRNGHYRITFNDNTIYNTYVVVASPDNMSEARILIVDYASNSFEAHMFDDSGASVNIYK